MVEAAFAVPQVGSGKTAPAKMLMPAPMAAKVCTYHHAFPETFVNREWIPALLASSLAIGTMQNNRRKKHQKFSINHRVILFQRHARRARGGEQEDIMMRSLATTSDESMADRESGYLHLLGVAERATLQALRKRLPSLLSKSLSPWIWGINLNTDTDASNIILLKFLRAEDMDVEKAADRLAETLTFRANGEIDELSSAELPEQFLGHDSIGLSWDGQPVMISQYGKMDNQKVFGDIDAFVKYRVQVMEKTIALLHFEMGAPETVYQVHDYSGVSVFSKTKEVKAGIDAMSKVFARYYPETKGATIFFNMPQVFVALFDLFSKFIPERTRRKFRLLGEASHAELFDIVPPEVVPESLGGLLSNERRNLTGQCTVVQVNAGAKEDVVLKEVRGPATLLWELRICKDQICHELAFVPATGKPIIIHNTTGDHPLDSSSGIVSGKFHAQEAGILKCSFSNQKAWFKKKVCVVRAEVQ